MTLPPLSIIVPTYGRSRCLAEVLECFRRQEYDGTLELVILNDVHQQHFWTQTPGTTIVNDSERYPSLGDKRNATVLCARHDHFLFVDDDDIFMPWYARTMMEAFVSWGKPVYPHRHYYATGRKESLKMRIVEQTHPASYLMTKEQFAKIGGYPFVYAGGDQLIRSKIYREFQCLPAFCPISIPVGYIYRWGNDVYHISGDNEHSTAWDRTAKSLQRRLASGEEPSGNIELKPAWEVDYLLAAQQAKHK